MRDIRKLKWFWRI